MVSILQSHTTCGIVFVIKCVIRRSGHSVSKIMDSHNGYCVCRSKGKKCLEQLERQISAHNRKRIADPSGSKFTVFSIEHCSKRLLLRVISLGIALDTLYRGQEDSHNSAGNFIRPLIEEVMNCPQFAPQRGGCWRRCQEGECMRLDGIEYE